uniref:sphinganine-1-phosphate aldolase n=1 Tax=Wuchereria bancrofti TaxID=6293 RepID=A0A1I8E8J1_WUCBA
MAIKSVLVSVDHTFREINPWKLVIGTAVSVILLQRIRRIWRASEQPIHLRLLGKVFSIICSLPPIRKRLEKELGCTQKKIFREIHKCDNTGLFFFILPESGMDSVKIISIAEQYNAMTELNVLSGKVSGAVYTDQNSKQSDLLSKIFDIYAYANPLHPDIFAGCRKMEAEVVHIVANLFHGGSNCRGTVTSGGTESILLAMLSYRNYANVKGISEPEILVPITAHAAFDKAAHLFRMRIRHIPVGNNQKVDIDKMQQAISSDTCVLVGSAPNFPTGTMDDIEQIAQLGQKYDIPVHVDACLGGFLIVFMEECGYPLMPFDFRLSGVTSISCDTHKYGYAPKGSSVILYREGKYLHHQYMCFPEWTGGIYATPTFAGSRSGLAISLAWATLLSFGRSGYVQRTKKIIQCARRISSAIANDIDGLRLLGSPDVSIVAFTSDVFNIYVLVDGMSALGWNLNSIQNPAGQVLEKSLHYKSEVVEKKIRPFWIVCRKIAHICVTYNTALANAWRTFIDDLRKVAFALMNDPDREKHSNMAAIYGLAATIPDKQLISNLTHCYLDACYTAPSLEAPKC